MINRLSIFNYQSHKQTELEFSKGINAIIGVTDSGKSGIFRALNWLCNNHPSSGHPSWLSSKPMEVTGCFDDVSVCRAKRKGTNEYRLDGGEPFKAIRGSVPEEVRRAVNMGPVNWQDQHSQHFLLSSTAGEVGRQLNEVVQLDIIDRSVSRIASMVRENNAEMQATASLLDEHKEDLEQFGYLDKMEAMVEEYEGLRDEQSDCDNRRKGINSILERIETTEVNIREAESILEVRPHVKKVEQTVHAWVDLVKREMRINSVISSIEEVKERIRKNREKLKKLTKQWDGLMPDVCPLCGK